MRIIYDGECPFCSSYVHLLRLREMDRVELLDARTVPDVVQRYGQLGLDLNQGMILELGNEIFWGDECVHKLALLTTSVGWFNRLNKAIFKSKQLSRTLYPTLRTARNLVLRLKGVKAL